ncbi:hypothetical protein AX16_010236 [Volvariella volvacea WC 439]|nr:hypothetical protein AX16_010236 [Volvariella volvacea WC 439]
MASQQTQLHHFIPRFLLKRYEDHRAKISIVTLNKGQCYSSLVSKSFGMADLYVDPLSADPNHIEQKLSVMEGMMGRVLRQLEQCIDMSTQATSPADTIRITFDEMHTIQKFCFLMWLRHPTSLSELNPCSSPPATDLHVAWRNALAFFLSASHQELLKAAAASRCLTCDGADTVPSSSVQQQRYLIGAHADDVANHSDPKLAEFYHLHTHYDKAVILEASESDEFMLGERRVAWIVRRPQSADPHGANEAIVYNQVHVVSPKLAIVFQYSVPACNRERFKIMLLPIWEHDFSDDINQFVDSLVQSVSLNSMPSSPNKQRKRPKRVDHYVVRRKKLSPTETSILNTIVCTRHSNGGHLTCRRDNLSPSSLALLGPHLAVRKKSTSRAQGGRSLFRMNACSVFAMWPYWSLNEHQLV